MIYLQLFWEFLQIGTFAFGGAYGAVPLMHDLVMARGGMDEIMFANLIAISESTPGPIIVNMATFIGSQEAGFLGGLCATLGIVLPSFIMILLITAYCKKVMQKPTVQAVLKGVKPCIMGIILSTGCVLAYNAVCSDEASFSIDLKSLCILCLLVGALAIYKKVTKKALSPITFICLSALCGIVFF